jgi:2-polyprenyl-3-methyl-5-hydroxy-6-metoxy-1,4-benzoquinol methylase
MTGASMGALGSWRALLSIDLKERSDWREILDDHTADDALVAPTLRNLERINVMLSGVRSICRRTLFRGIRKNGDQTMSIADLGCGGGDLALWCAGQCARRGIRARIVGIDRDPRVAAIAKNRCAQEPSITIVNGDATDPDILPDPIDWILSNHFLHHLSSAKISQVLKNAASKARHGVIMNDLIRSRLSLIAFNLLCHSITPSGCTAHDGIISILRSLTRTELDLAIADAGLRGSVHIFSTGIGHRAVVITIHRPSCR